MLNQKRRHQVALAGQVIDSVTGDAIAGARIKIVQAPDRFIDIVLFKAKLFYLSKSLCLKPSFSKISNSPLEHLLSTIPSIQGLQETLNDPQISNKVKLELFINLVTNSPLNNHQKFQIFQYILDHSQTSKITPKIINDEHLERTYSSLDGWFYFADLPVGSYQLEASLPMAEKRYASTLISVDIDEIKFNTELDQNSSFSDKLNVILKLNPTTIFGKVTDSNTNEYIDMAKVKVYGNTDYAISSKTVSQDEQRKWNYRLVALDFYEPIVTLIVSARNYTTQQHQIHLQTGDIKQVDFELFAQ